MIQLEKVNKYFNKGKKNEIHVINNTSLTLPDKGLVALLGPSGCGKTTLLNALGGLDKIKSGKIYVNGKRISKRRSYQVDKIRNLEIGYIFQNYYLLDNETVFDNVAISLKMIGIKSKQEIKKRVNYVLETLGIYRYRNRLAGMLSGGERQRVGIARAIVKEPNIIIADEPTGNLDSGNTIEIMNIIKSISKNRLVILVTHETNLAEFYADRIIEIEDGLVKNDYETKKHDILDYRIENEFYLKDFKNCSHFENEDNEINIYNDKKNDIKLTIVVKNNNIYIKAGKNDKIEVVDNDSNIKFINDHYKQIDKSVYEDYEFDFDKVVNKNHKPRYSSIVNPFTIVFQGIKKIFNYSIIKKILLFGFFGSGLFICYSVCNIAGLNHVENSYFIENNENYYSANVAKLTPEKFNELENLESVSYILPGKSNVNFRAKYNYYYQTMEAQDNLGGSLVSNKNLKEDDILYGRLPKDINELVMDKMVFDRLFETGYSTSKNVGMNSAKDYLNTTVYGKYGFMYTIVGIVNLDSPSIYAYEETFINLLNTNEDEEYYNEEIDDTRILDYKMVSGIKITKGRLPENDYEVIVDKQNEFMYPLNKKIDVKVNDTKLTVVGYYELTEPIEEYGLIQDEEGTYGVYTYADESVLRNSYFVNNNKPNIK